MSFAAFAAGVSVMLLVSCTTKMSPGAARIVWAETHQEVADCEALGTVQGQSTQSGDLNEDVGLNNARVEALEGAASRGASHVIWLEVNKGLEITVTGAAFACPVVRSPEEPEDDERAVAANQPRADSPASRNRAEPIATTTSEPPPSSERKTAPAPTSPLPTIGLGSCFFVSEAGIVVTNHHVVANAAKISVLDSTGTEHVATVLRDLPEIDLAALDVPTATRHSALAVDTAAQSLSLGQPVFTIGFPYPSTLGFDPKFADGAISGMSGFGDPRLLQLTVPVQPGNSGGPLVNNAGVVVGVISSRLSDMAMLEETGSLPENVSFAVRATEVAKLLRGLVLPKLPLAKTRAAAIRRTQGAVCQVLTVLRADE